MTAAVAAHPARAAQPNILVIVTDDQRQGTLREMPNTRHFFFDEGRYFQRGFVTTPNCCPSRASIFTGLFAHNHGIRSNGTADLPQRRDGTALPARRRLQDRDPRQVPELLVTREGAALLRPLGGRPRGFLCERRL